MSGREAPPTAEAIGQRGVAVVGAGGIGVGFAVLFGAAGVPVRMFDPDSNALERAQSEVDDRLEMLDRHGLNTGSPATIAWEPDLAEAVGEACLVQECAPEDAAVKHDLFDRMGRIAAPDAVLASSSSALVPSSYGAESAARSRIIGAHPGNPPYLLPLVELIPAPWTEQTTVDSARTVYQLAGMRTVLVRKEIEGFLFNRLQGAVLREAYCLLRDGVADVDDIDEVMRSALGRRWSIAGPFETADLNVRGGLAAHAQRMGAAYERMGAQRGQHDPWTPDLVDEATRQRRALLPLDRWEAGVRWRDEALMRIRALDGSVPLRAEHDDRKGGQA